MPNIAVLLSGCGVFDGAEIHESVLTLLALAHQGADSHCIAPNMLQTSVVDHTSQQNGTSERNVLVESARIARGDISPLNAVSADNFDALIVPGGFGVAKNLSNFATAGADCEVNPEVKQFCQGFIQEKKPMGFICIAPVMLPKLFTSKVTVTIGEDAATAEAIQLMGGQHQDCPANEIVEDYDNKLVTTPGYMSAKNLLELEQGINMLVKRVLDFI